MSAFKHEETTPSFSVTNCSKCYISDTWEREWFLHWSSGVSIGGATGAAAPSGAHEVRKKKTTAVQNCHRPLFLWMKYWGQAGKVMLSGLDACQSWWVTYHHLSAVSAAEHCGPSWCMSFSPGQESYHTIKYQIIAGAFFFVFQSFNRPGVYLGQAFNSFLTKIWDENVTNFASFSVNSLASFWAIVVFCKWSCAAEETI